MQIVAFKTKNNIFTIKLEVCFLLKHLTCTFFVFPVKKALNTSKLSKFYVAPKVYELHRKYGFNVFYYTP